MRKSGFDCKDIETARKIAIFYLEKNSHNNGGAKSDWLCNQISDLHTFANAIVIETSNPTRVVGKDGELLTKLEAFLGKKVVILHKESVVDMVMRYIDDETIKPQKR